MASEAQNRAVAKYDAKNTKQFHLKLNLKMDAEIIKKLEQVGNIQGYIKRLIEEDMRQNP